MLAGAIPAAALTLVSELAFEGIVLWRNDYKSGSTDLSAIQATLFELQ
jgi:hypothetical protein